MAKLRIPECELYKTLRGITPKEWDLSIDRQDYDRKILLSLEREGQRYETKLPARKTVGELNYNDDEIKVLTRYIEETTKEWDEGS